MPFVRRSADAFLFAPRIAILLVAAVAALVGLPCPAGEIALTFVTVGDPGNPGNRHFGGSPGSVPYSYSIGKSPVTNAQFALFLDAVAARDPHRIYSPNMKIRRSGRPGSYSYVPLAGWEKHPVEFVAGIDAIRFCNWLHNGMPVGPQDHGTTEDGAYLIQGNNIPEPRNPDARFFLPTRNEWVKAALHDPTREAAMPYRFFAHGSDEEPIAAKPSALPGRVNARNVVGETTPVGAYPNTQSYWGALDMIGNVENWCESGGGASYQLHLGTSFRGSTEPGALGAHYAGANVPNSSRRAGLGFRVAAIAPATEEVTWGSLFPPSKRQNDLSAADEPGISRSPAPAKLPVEKPFPEPPPELAATTGCLEKVRDLISRHDKWKAAIEVKRDAVLAIIEKEKIAERLSPDDARDLELKIRPLSSSNGNSPAFLRAGIQLAGPHPAIAQAVSELDAACTPLIGGRGEFLDECSKALLEMTTRAFMEKLTPGEIANRIALVEATKSIDCLDNHRLDRDAHIKALGSLKDLTEAGLPPFPEAHARRVKAFAALREVRYVRTEPIQLCLQRHYAPYAREAIRCRYELDAAIVGGKTADDLRKLFVVWRDATQQRNALSPFQERRSEDYEIGKAYQAVVDAVAATESPDLNAEKIPALRWEVGPQARQLGPTRSALFLARLDETIARISKRTHDPFRSEMATIRQQLGGIRDPAALMTFAAGLPDRSAPGQDAGRSTTRPALRRTLLLLAEAWSATDLEMFRQVRGVAAAEDVTFYAPLQVLLARVERDILAAELNLPELTKEPLASMAPDAAMEALCDALASRGEWRSLLRFVEARIGNRPTGQDPGWRDSAAAIKAYLIGQNQELAGLNAEAAAYYRQTLATLAARGPTREAVARLKALHGQIKQPTR